MKTTRRESFWRTLQIFLLFFFFPPILAQIHPAPTITVVKSALGFTENEKIIFSCISKKIPSDIVYYWFVRDPITKVKTFPQNNSQRVFGPMSANERGEAKFPLLLRRDFSHMEMVCRRGLREASYLLPLIKEILPIDEVRLGPTDLALAKQFRLICDVKASPGVVQKVAFRSDAAFDLSTNNKTLGGGWKRFELTRNWTRRLDRSAVVCVASTSSAFSLNGSVVSKASVIRVHYFEFRNVDGVDKRSVKRGALVRFSFTAEANPMPLKHQMSAILHLKNGFRTVRDSDAEIIHLGGNKYKIHVDFKPPASGSYSVRFSSNVMAENSSAVNISVSCCNFQKEFDSWNNRTVNDGASVSLNFSICASLLAGKDQFRFRVIGSQNGKEVIAAVTEISQHEELKNLYFVKMTFVPPFSGEYQVTAVFRDKEIKSPMFRIEINPEGDGGSTPWKMIPVICAVIAIICFVIGIFLYWRFIYSAIKLRILVDGTSKRVTLPKTATFADLEKTLKDFSDPDSDGNRLQMKEMRAQIKLIKLTKIKRRTDGYEQEQDAPLWIRCDDKPKAKKLTENGFSSGLEMKYEIVAPKSFEIAFVEPENSNVKKETETVEAENAPLWGDICENEKIENKIFEDSVAFQFGYFYLRGNEEKRFAIEAENQKFFDVEDGEEVAWDQWKEIYRNFLKKDSQLLWAPNHRARVYVREHCDLYKVDENGSYHQLSIDDVFHEQWLAFIRGLRFVNEQETDISKHTQFVEIYEGILVDIKDGKQYENEDDIMKQKDKFEDTAWRNYYMFFKENDVFPKWNVIEEKKKFRFLLSAGSFLVFRRDDLKLTVNKEERFLHLHCNDKSKTIKTELSNWYRPKAEDQFEMDFTDCFRRNAV